MQKAMSIATEAEINQYGYQLLFGGKVDEAIKIFQKNVKDHPDSWNVYDSLGEGYATKGDTKKAIEYYTKALNMVKDEDQKKRITGILDKLNK
jgi:tetratricopeptide (TPR) repeat protein